MSDPLISVTIQNWFSRHDCMVSWRHTYMIWCHTRNFKKLINLIVTSLSIWEQYSFNSINDFLLRFHQIRQHHWLHDDWRDSLVAFLNPVTTNAVSSVKVKSSKIDTLIYDEVRDLVVFRICIVDRILFVIRMSLMIISRGDTWVRFFLRYYTVFITAVSRICWLYH